MKIALLTPTFSSYSGIDRVVELQSRELAAGGADVTIFAFEADLKPPPGVKLKVLGMPRKLLWQRIYRLLLPLNHGGNRKTLSLLSGFNTIYSHQYPMNWLAYLAQKRFGARYIYYDHGIAPPFTFASIADRIYMRFFSRIANLTIKKADEAISVSRYLQGELKKSTGIVSRVVYNRVDMSRFTSGLNGLPIREKYGLAGRPVILYVGRISPHKGVHLLIEAFKLLKREFADACLLIVGRQTFDTYLKKLNSMGDDSIIYSGYVGDDEIAEYYAACDIYATATLWEGFDLPIVEAQACGKPVVAFALGPHPEVVINGETGILTPVSDISALAGAMAGLLGNNEAKSEMGAKARKFVCERFA